METESSVTFSFEVFPAKTAELKPGLYQELRLLAPLCPEFISVTCGAGGTDNQSNFDTCDFIQNTLRTKCMAHICCIGQTKATVDEKFRIYHKLGIHSFLALRGDFPPNTNMAQFKNAEFCHASDLVSHIKKQYPEFNISVAGYPEGHNQNPSKEDDFKFQLEKAKKGVERVITQLFLDNRLFFDYVSAMSNNGYNGPVIPGIFPVTNPKQIVKIAGLCGAFIPKRVLDACEKYKDDAESMEQWGIDYAVAQIEELAHFNHKRIHLYTMNQSKHVMKIQNHFKPKYVHHKLLTKYA